MNLIITSLSSLKSPVIDCDIPNIHIKQFQRFYPGNCNINFVNAYSNSQDFKVKNYTNFYLTDVATFSDIFSINTPRLKSEKISTFITFGGQYLNIFPIDITPYKDIGNIKQSLKYRAGRFLPDQSSPIILEIFENNKCHLYYRSDDNQMKYYLVVDDKQTVFFIEEGELTFDPNYINAQDFLYLFSESFNYMMFYKKTPTGILILTKVGNGLGVIPNQNHYITPFGISKNIYTYPNIKMDNSFVTYNIDNTVNPDKSRFDLKNNFLMHRKFTSNDYTTSLITLKNQLTNLDVFSNANTLLSSANDLSVDSYRRYTSIFEDIPQEHNEELELNYEFGNQVYQIQSGDNNITSPSNMFPFGQIHINDLKFIQSGAYPNTTPEHSDRIYQLSDNITNLNDGQYLLCTWLYKNPITNQISWLDRYYYPDLIEKHAALQGHPYFINSTNDQLIESIISQNSGASDQLQYNKYIDFNSNMMFYPDTTYNYHRVVPIQRTYDISTSSQCTTNTLHSINFFKNINTSSQFTISFKFNGDGSTWSIESDRNEIPCGITISKIGNNISISYNIYNPTTASYDSFNYTAAIRAFKTNFLAISVDGITGQGYVIINNEVVYTFDFTPYKYIKRQLLYGDCYIHINNQIIDIRSSEMINVTEVFDVLVDDTFTSKDIIMLFSAEDGKNLIDDIYITLPCGVRNATDNISLIQQVCNNSARKSNNINIILKNIVDISPTTKDNIVSYIRTSMEDLLPQNIIISNITFENYK